jgi:FkbM family methyltransferase
VIKTAKKTLQRALHLFGLDVKWHVPHPAHDLFELLKLYRVETVFDIGANSGVSGEYFRNIGFAGKIVSFEPVRDLYRQLQEKAIKDPLWLSENVAIGDQEGEQEINLTGGFGAANSFLVSTGHMEQVAPELATIGRQMVKVRTLHSVIEEHYQRGNRLFLKIDAQGYEKKILEVAGDQLSKVVGMRIEFSIVRSYEGEPLICDMLPYLYELGYRVCAIEEAWSNRTTQEVYQVDAVLFRPEKLDGK